MENKSDKTKQPHNTTRKIMTVLLGFACLAAAILMVSVLTAHHTEISKKSPQPSSRVAVVRITKTGFEPATLSVKQGTKIIWTNADSNLHQVASNPYPEDTGLPSLKSEILNNTQTYTYIANKAGSFGYHDQMQPTINGTIVVQKQ